MKKSPRGGGSGPSSKPAKKKPVKNARSLLEVLGFGRKKAVADPEADAPEEAPERPSLTRATGGRGGLQLKTSYAARSQNADQGGRIGGSRGASSGGRRPEKAQKSYRDSGKSAKSGGGRGDDRDSRQDRSSRQDRGGRSSSGGDGKQARGSGRGSGRAFTPPSTRPAQARGQGQNQNQNQNQSRNGTKSASSDPSVVSKGRGQGSPRIEGIIKRHPDGFGFLIASDPAQPDVYISRQYMTGVMTNDRVEAEIYKARDEDRWFGEITKVVKRASSVIVGRYLPVDFKYGVIQDDGRGWGMDLRILAENSLSAKDGDLVAVEILQYPMRDREFTGRVVSIIGDVEDPMNDVKRVIFGHHIPHEFSEKARSEAQAFGGRVHESDIEGRKDVRQLPLITIDGATAKDFDDAVYVESTESGFKLWVAIADVSHYVKPGTTLDQEAYERGTSTYFPNFVVPMLPEELSNDLCSLNPKVPRLCFVCEMTLGFQGELQKYEFYEAVMESKARVTYGEAQEVIDGSPPDRLQHVAAHIRTSADLAKILMAKRFREGSLDLEIPETQVVVDGTGRTSDIIRSERLFAHRLIEELMLITNVCCARFMEDNNIPGIYRIHDEPKSENIETLQRYLWNFGGQNSMVGGKLQKKIGSALEAFHGRPEAQILNILTLRSMNQAKYSAQNIGHFGLGFSHYSHFTSPIRRYPDLIAHRLIKSVLYPKYRSFGLTEDELSTATTMLSACEQRSVKAERQVISIKKARFMQQFVGQEFDGMVSSVAKFGCFVLLRAYDVDGLVKMEDLGDDRFVFDEENLRLIGRRTGLQWTIGDSARVVVRGVDAEAGRIDLALAAEQPERAAYADELPKDDDRRGRGSRGDKRAQNKERHGKPQASGQTPTEGDRKRDQKRGSSEDDRGDVRKARLSKRRRKN